MKLQRDLIFYRLHIDERSQTVYQECALTFAITISKFLNEIS